MLSRFRLHFILGLFALVTLLLAGASVGRRLGLSAGDGAYLMLLLLAMIGWFASRHLYRKEL